MKKCLSYGLGFIVVMLFMRCANEKEMPHKEDVVLTLRWIPSHADEEQDDAITGLTWACSFLGASLPLEYQRDAITIGSDEMITLNFNKLGFPENALQALSDLIAVLKSSEEYKMYGSITMGRFIALTINSSNHYYKITGARPSLAEFDRQYTYGETKAAVIPSAISKGDRLIHIGTATTAESIAFKAEEGTGEIAQDTYTSKEFEVIDVMKNGQLRFAIYDEQGALIPFSDSTLSISGKPAKCLWCHETHLLPSFETTATIPGYMNGSEFAGLIESRMQTLTAYRNELLSSLDFINESDHELMEIMYISFMEPSVAVLAKEWNKTEQEIQDMLSAYTTHVHHEFPFLGNLYHRHEIEANAPFTAIQVPQDAREASGYEPDLIP